MLRPHEGHSPSTPGPRWHGYYRVGMGAHKPTGASGQTSGMAAGRVTFLFSDLEGSTRLLHELGAGYGQLLREHRAVVREVVSARGGVEIDTQGDAFFIAFADPEVALLAAREIQQQHDGWRLRVRIGLHTGAADRTAEGGYVGLAVHEAARICAAAHGGQVLVSDATRELVTLPLHDLGEYRLKDFPNPVRLFQLGDGDFGPPRTPGVVRLPTPTTAFVGREQDVSEILELLRRAPSRLVTLTGAGGSGKTRVALEVARRLVDDCTDGVFFVDLSAVATVDGAWAAIGQALGASRSVEDRVGDGHVLLVLDNLEQIVPVGSSVGARLTALLEACPRCRILVTSRIPLHIRAEVERPVEPLARSEAVELFTARARTLVHDFQADAAVAEICRRLDDLPLAVELAAARMRILSTAELLNRLDRRLRVLARGPDDVVERQRTLEATIAWSYNLLGAGDRAVFARLGVFAGGWTLGAAEAVCDASLDALAVLVEGNLVRRERGRFRMLETIHEYAAERLVESREQAAMRERHARYFHDLATLAGASGRDERAPSDLIENDGPNTEVALAYLLDQPSTDEALELALALWQSWVNRGRLVEGDAWMSRALARADHTNLVLWGEGLTVAAEFARFRGDFVRAMELKHQALPLARRLGRTARVAATLTDMGDIEILGGNFLAARPLLDEAVALRRTLARPLGIAHALSGLADLELAEGSPAAAVGHLEEALAIVRAEGLFSETTRPVGAMTLLALGAAHRQLGHSDLARQLIAEGLQVSLAVGVVYATRTGLEEMAAITAERGDAERAAQLLGAAARILRETGFVDDTAAERSLTEQATRSALGQTRYDTAFAAGLELPLEEAVRLAVG